MALKTGEEIFDGVLMPRDTTIKGGKELTAKEEEVGQKGVGDGLS